MKKSIAFCLIFACGVMPVFSSSNFESIPPGNWAKVESLTGGEEISMKLLFGDKMEGKYLSIDLENVHLYIDGKERSYLKKDIAEVRLVKINDSALEGTLIGFAAGAIPTGILMGSYASNESREGTRGALIGIALGGGIGAFIGALSDGLHKGSKLIYRATGND